MPASAKKKEKFKSFGDLLSFLEGASDHEIERIWAVSAYYDIDSIEQLIEHIKSRSSKKPELVIVIGTIKHKGLEELQKVKFGNEFKEGSGIRVTHCGYLFHSKGYWVETTRGGMCAIGSMNLTKYGLKEHEEILAYSQYKHSKALPPLVESFKKYVEDWRSDKRSKEIGAISQGEKGIRWLPENKDWNEARNDFIYAGKQIRVAKRVQNEFAQGNDSNGLPSDTEFPTAPSFPDITDELDIQRYFRELKFPPELNNQGFDHERKFTLALYKLLFQECGKNPREHEHDGVTLQYRDAKWRRGFAEYHPTWRKKVDNRMQHLTCSARFDVTLKSKGLICDVFVYPYSENNYYSLNKSVGFRGISLAVRVKNKQKKVANLQLLVSKLVWENIWNDKGQYWEIYSDGSMQGVKPEEVLSAVREDRRTRCWIKEPTSWSKGKELVHLGNLPVAEKATWRNSRNFLAQLLHYEIIRANIRFSRAK